MEEESEEKEEETEESEEEEHAEKAVEETKEVTEEIEEPAEALEDEEAVEEEVEAEEEVSTVEEKVKPPRRREVEEEFVEERIYTIPLGRVWIVPPKKRSPRAIKMIKDFVKRHMKLEPQGEMEEEEEPKRLIISNEVNERVWRRGIEKPPRKVRVRAAKDKDGNITVFLAEGD